MDALFRREMARDMALLDTGALVGLVGAFEGANYEAKGYFRPQPDCIMFSRDPVGFCQVCRRAIDVDSRSLHRACGCIDWAPKVFGTFANVGAGPA